MTEVQTSMETSSSPKWQPLDSLQRRVLGVLVEKAKTTPDSYPLTVNSIKTACNQKSNRKPQMDLDADDVMATLDELREMGAVAELQGDGRTSKFRHLAYQWLGVDKIELAVLAELLLRGEQTVGELRGRAARMEPIDGLTGLRPVLVSLRQKKLMVEVTAAGRGQIITHGLFPASEQTAATVLTETASSDPPAVLAPGTSAVSAEPVDDTQMVTMQDRIEELTQRVSRLEDRLESLTG